MTGPELAKILRRLQDVECPAEYRTEQNELVNENLDLIIAALEADEWVATRDMLPKEDDGDVLAISRFGERSIVDVDVMKRDSSNYYKFWRPMPKGPSK